MKFTFRISFYLFVVFFLLGGMTVSAQDAPKKFYISGTVISKNLDTILVSAVTSKDEIKIPLEKDGHFKKEIDVSGPFMVKVYSTHGKQIKEIKIDPKSLPGFDIGIINVDDKVIDLKQVQINGRQILAKSNAQKTTYQIEGNKSFMGDNLRDVVSKLPGLFNNDNVLNVNGSSNVRISLNGKEYKLPDNKAKMDFLRSLNASDVKNIEVYNPSAKNSHSDYVININSKDLSDGFSVSPNINFSTGAYSALSASGFAQMKKNKVAASLYTSNGYEDSYMTQEEQNTFTHAFLSSKSDLVERKRSSYNQLDIDYSPSKRTLLGASVSGSFFKNRGSQNGQFRSVHPTTDSTLNNETALNKNSQYIISNLFIRQIVDTTGSEISLSLDANHFNTLARNEFLSGVVFPESGAWQTFSGQSENRNKILVLSGALNFKTAFEKRKGLIETGIRFNRSQSDLYNYLVTTPPFAYEDQLGSIYGNLNYAFGRSSVQIGIRAETFKLNSGNVIKRYHYLLPFISYSTKLFNNTVPLNIQYTSKAGRPSFASFSPIVNVRNQYSSYSGNANLGMSRNNELSANVSWKNFYLTVGYSEVKDGNVSMPMVNGENTLLYMPLQVKKQRGLNLGISYNIKIHGVNLFANSVYSNQWFNDAQFVDLRRNAELMILSINGSYNIGKNAKVEASGSYLPIITTMTKDIHAKSKVNLKYNQVLFKNFNTSIFVEDLFYANVERGTTILIGADGTFDNKFDSRRIGFSIGYNFRKGKSVKLVNKSQNNSETRSRINN